MTARLTVRVLPPHDGNVMYFPVNKSRHAFITRLSAGLVKKLWTNLHEILEHCRLWENEQSVRFLAVTFRGWMVER